MQIHEFLGQVQHRAKLADFDEALRASRATLETLAERLGGNEPEHLAAQLPQEIGEFLRRGSSNGTQRFSSDEFLQRVCQREGVDLPDAVHHARVVLEVLGEAVTPGEMGDVRAQLPADYQRLFDAGSQGPMRNA